MNTPSMWCPEPPYFVMEATSNCQSASNAQSKCWSYRAYWMWRAWMPMIAAWINSSSDLFFTVQEQKLQKLDMKNHLLNFQKVVEEWSNLADPCCNVYRRFDFPNRFFMKMHNPTSWLNSQVVEGEELMTTRLVVGTSRPIDPADVDRSTRARLILNDILTSCTLVFSPTHPCTRQPPSSCDLSHCLQWASDDE